MTKLSFGRDSYKYILRLLGRARVGTKYFNSQYENPRVINHTINSPPPVYSELVSRCKDIGFTMPSDASIGSLLRTLVASKPNSNFLELGTGIGLALSWMIDGMDKYSKLTSIDNDQGLVDIAQEYLGNDKRVQIACIDGIEWINNYSGPKFDLVFADTWPGKYGQLEEVLNLINVGGLYIIDDMLPQSDWPDGHAEKAQQLVSQLEKRVDLTLTKMNWSTGIIMATKNADSK